MMSARKRRRSEIVAGSVAARSVVVDRLVASLERIPGSVRRSVPIAERNAVAARSSHWVVFVAGAAEPLFYLLAVGVGLGAIAGDVRTSGSQPISYTAFVAPGMLAAAAMSGAVSETALNFFDKLRYLKLYEAVLATPIRPFELALGELIWAVVRGTTYSLSFLVVLTATNLTTFGGAVAAIPATLLSTAAFGSLGMMAATYMRGWPDFSVVNFVQSSLFLVSGTFFPIEVYPAVIQWLVQATPLFHAVELIRGITLGFTAVSLIWHIVYLVGCTVLGILVAKRRLSRMLYR